MVMQLHRAVVEPSKMRRLEVWESMELDNTYMSSVVSSKKLPKSLRVRTFGANLPNFKDEHVVCLFVLNYLVQKRTATERCASFRKRRRS